MFGLEECTKFVDVEPNKVLRPVGTTFQEYVEDMTTTDLPKTVIWKVVGYLESFVSRCGETLFYRRNEEIRLV